MKHHKKVIQECQHLMMAFYYYNVMNFFMK